MEVLDREAESQPMESDSVVFLDEVKLHQVIVNGSLNFDEWTSLISEVDKSCSDNIEIICSVYESFLSKFPLCYGYWRKYADHKIHMCTVDKMVEVFEQAVESATHSVDLWVDYCTFGSLVFEDPSDVRRLFKRGISFVGKDYLCHTLWDKYIDFEFSKKHWDSLTNIYIQTLRFPTKKLHRYYDSFKKFVRISEEEMEAHSNSTLEASVESQLESQVPCYKQEDISCIIKDLLDPSVGLARFKALQKYKCIGERFYKEASDLNEKIDRFESQIKRSYFHVKPLDANQLENWHHYLDFAELHGDFDWVVKLYERCLIPCANYPEFWMRYVEFIESKGGREIANFALGRATQIFLKRVSAIHQFNARFKEHTGDVINARAAFLQCDTESDSAFVENVVMRANMEKRLGNFIEASNVYKEALEMAERKDKCHILPSLYVHFSRLKYMTTDSEDAARDILLDGIKHMPYCKLLIKELITFAMTHRRSGNINMVDSIVVNAISPAPGVSQGLSTKDGEDISRLYLEFVDLCGTVNDVRNAWNRHVKLFSHSMRTTTYHSATGTKKWKVNMESHQETLIALPRQPSGDCSSDNLIQSSLQDEKLSLLENQDTQAAHPASDHVVQNNNMPSDQARVDLHIPGESDNNEQESLQGSLKVSEPCGEGASEPIVSLDLVHQVGNEIEGAQASLECSTENDVQQESEHEPEQNLMPPSLERLSLVTPQTHDSKAPQEISSFLPTSPEVETHHEKSVSNRSTLKSEDPRENSLSNGSMPSVDNFLSSPMSTQAPFLDPVNTGHASPSSSASYQNIKTQELSQPHMPENSGRSWHQRSHSDRHRRDSKFGFRGHSHRRLHQKQQASPQRHYARTETGSQMPKSQGYSSQPLPSQSPQIQQGSQVQGQFPASTAHANLTAPQAWPVHNVQQQNLTSACQSQPPVQPGTYPQAQMSQYPMQSNEQHGNVQNNQAYNQMWQYYYYQQQQQFLWQQQQQQQLQQQQPQQQQPQQQLLMQQYQQQQFLQMQYLQQQQLQQQQLPYQQQQLQQLQQELQPQLPQQLVQQQQQPYQLQQEPSQQQQVQQQHLVYLQQQQQMQLQHQQHNQLQLQLQQQQHYQQQAVPQQQQHDEQGQSAAVQVQDAAHNKDTSGIVEFPASSNPQQQSPQTQ